MPTTSASALSINSFSFLLMFATRYPVQSTTVTGFPVFTDFLGSVEEPFFGSPTTFLQTFASLTVIAPTLGVEVPTHTDRGRVALAAAAPTDVEDSGFDRRKRHDTKENARLLWQLGPKAHYMWMTHCQ